MKLRTLGLLALLLVSATAQANPTRVMLRYRQSNGTVNPLNRVIHFCDIYSDKVLKYLRGPAVRPMVPPVPLEVQWTDAVPNARVARRLLTAVQSQESDVRNGPVGGASYFHEGFLYHNGQEEADFVVIRQIAGQIVENLSDEATDLRELIDLNCR